MGPKGGVFRLGWVSAVLCIVVLLAGPVVADWDDEPDIIPGSNGSTLPGTENPLADPGILWYPVLAVTFQAIF